MRLLLRHALVQTLELLRFPTFSFPTLALPALFFAFFAIPRADGNADVLLASFCAYALLSVAFFQFGVGIASERERPWESYLRTLPVGVATRLGARGLSACLFGTGAVAAVVAVALPTTSVALGARAWLELAGVLAAGFAALTPLGLALGYWLSPKGALPIANVLYLSLSYVGGLWTGPHGLPAAIADAGAWTPTRVWGRLLWPAAGSGTWHVRDWLVLAAYAVAFAALAVWGYRRDEGLRYR